MSKYIMKLNTKDNLSLKELGLLSNYLNFLISVPDYLEKIEGKKNIKEVGVSNKIKDFEYDAVNRYYEYLEKNDKEELDKLLNDGKKELFKYLKRNLSYYLNNSDLNSSDIISILGDLIKSNQNDKLEKINEIIGNLREIIKYSDIISKKLEINFNLERIYDKIDSKSIQEIDSKSIQEIDTTINKLERIRSKRNNNKKNINSLINNLKIIRIILTILIGERYELIGERYEKNNVILLYLRNSNEFRQFLTAYKEITICKNNDYGDDIKIEQIESGSLYLVFKTTKKLLKFICFMPRKHKEYIKEILDKVKKGTKNITGEIINHFGMPKKYINCIKNFINKYGDNKIKDFLYLDCEKIGKTLCCFNKIMEEEKDSIIDIVSEIGKLSFTIGYSILNTFSKVISNKNEFSEIIELILDCSENKDK